MEMRKGKDRNWRQSLGGEISQQRKDILSAQRRRAGIRGHYEDTGADQKIGVLFHNKIVSLCL